MEALLLGAPGDVSKKSGGALAFSDRKHSAERHYSFSVLLANTI